MSNYYSGNYYLSLDQMNVNAEYIYSYLTNLGWSKNAICAILGNMQRESTINPGIWQNLDEGNTSLGYGLVQWTPATKYLNWCETLSLDPSHIESNLERIVYEVVNNIQYISTSEYPETFQEFVVSTKPVDYLTKAFLYNYERAGSLAEAERIQNALYWYQHLTGEVPPITPDEPDEPTKIQKKNHFNFILFNKRRNIYNARKR